MKLNHRNDHKCTSHIPTQLILNCFLQMSQTEYRKQSLTHSQRRFSALGFTKMLLEMYNPIKSVIWNHDVQILNKGKVNIATVKAPNGKEYWFEYEIEIAKAGSRDNAWKRVMIIKISFGSQFQKVSNGLCVEAFFDFVERSKVDMNPNPEQKEKKNWELLKEMRCLLKEMGCLWMSH